MNYTPEEIAKIVSKVVAQLDSASAKHSYSDTLSSVQASFGVCTDVNTAVERASRAFEVYRSFPVSRREEIVRAIRGISLEHIEELATGAWEETGLGRKEDKIAKNRLVIEKTPGTEDLFPKAFSGDDGLTLEENGAYGVIGSITPMTNPTETIISNSIGMIAAGNSVVFNPHPRAKNICCRAVHLINQAVQSCGGPQDLVTIVGKPSMESGQELMKHPGIRILVVTGGPGIVQAAFQSGKKVVAAGPGNPPAVVDETADLEEAAKNIVLGATLDNNILCIAEKEIFIVDSVADAFIQALKRHGGYQVIGANIRKLEQEILKDGKINADLIGKNADFILSKIGIQVPASVRMAFFECDFTHPLVKKEQMMPVLPLVRCPDVKTAIARAVEAEQGNFHTATMHSKNLDALHEMAVRSNVTIFVKNGPSCAGLGYGGEGFTTMTIAGPTGEGLTSAKTFTRKRRCVLRGHFRIV